MVEAGGDTAIGSIVAGTHKTLSDGGSSTPEPEAEPEPEPQDTTASRTLSWSPISGATYYYIQVYSHEAGKWVVRRAVSTTSVTFETTPGKHTVYLHAYISGRWWRVASQSMTL